MFPPGHQKIRQLGLLGSARLCRLWGRGDDWKTRRGEVGADADWVPVTEDEVFSNCSPGSLR